MDKKNNNLEVHTLNKKKKGWGEIYDSVMRLYNDSNMKYDEKEKVEKLSDDLKASSRVSLVLSSVGTTSPEDLCVAKKILSLCNLRSEFIKNYIDIDTPLVECQNINEYLKEKGKKKLMSYEPVYNPDNVVILKNCNAFINLVDGIYFVHWDAEKDQGPK
ncbi:AMP deaminase, putative, partial [Hepatocystis sp. ex Piliocolobus tephrosceles]